MNLNFFDNINVTYLNVFILVMFIILFFICISLMVKTSKLQKRYKEFMKKLGDGTSIEASLRKYIQKVEQVDAKNDEITNNIDSLDLRLNQCIQKIGIVRYNAYRDMGSELSFALALLDNQDDGIVINGIYSREVSNTYAKPIKGGKSNYTLSEEEQEAIKKAKEA